MDLEGISLFFYFALIIRPAYFYVYSISSNLEYPILSPFLKLYAIHISNMQLS